MDEHNSTNTNENGVSMASTARLISENGDVSDLDLEHADSIISVHPSYLKGRKKYTLDEDLAMLTYIIKTRQYRNTSGNSLWKDMELLKTTNHTWGSMKARYSKVILPAIDNYNIANSWKSLLSGDTSKSLTHNQNVSLSSVNSKQSKSPVKPNTNYGLFGDRPPCKKMKTASNLTETKEVLKSCNRVEIVEDFSDDESVVRAYPEKSPSSITPVKSGTKERSSPKSKCLQTDDSDVTVMSTALDDQDDNLDLSESREDNCNTVSSTNADGVNNDTKKSDHQSPMSISEDSSGDDFDRNLFKMTEEYKTSSPIKSLELVAVNTLNNQNTFNNLTTKLTKQTEVNTNVNTISPSNDMQRKKGQKIEENLRDFVMCASSESQTQYEVDEQCVESTMKDLKEIIQSFGAKYGMSKSQTISALYYLNGSVKDTIHWIEYGVDMDWLPAWTSKDDELLQSTNVVDTERLTRIYTEKGVHKRNLFFDDLIQ